jgi:hypothetical protein
MKRAKRYSSVQRHWYRPAERECAVCHRPLRQAMTLSRRTVVTLQAVIKLIHAGYRCPDLSCPGRSRIYRSAEADALALPGFTYGLDIVVLVGQLHLGKHQTLDEVHHEVQERLTALAVSISRREILYLFDAYCALLRASSDAKEDKDWLGRSKRMEGSSCRLTAFSRTEAMKPFTWCEMHLPVECLSPRTSSLQRQK